MADKFLSFATLISMAILATGDDVTTLPLRGMAGGIKNDFAAADGSGFTVPDLVRWGGLMGAGHDYYERGNVDVFSGRAPCLPSPPCRMNLTSDGSGAHHGWYCKSVEVTATGPHVGCAKAAFGVEQWLSTDALPYQLYADRSVCAKRRPDGELGC
ncbi:hypothetical protein GUJ93_ZPchr0014g46955 [Zizania palustris]|uniref:PLAT domain-containing protein n=1 Tax=Zizania palustris TaxID=103762 RepID=A0A8J5VRV2_ZIZPA|nr:hypothetical protein GUJ93_ZPchr0014g46955 [Zizania palustris]